MIKKLRVILSTRRGSLIGSMTMMTPMPSFLASGKRAQNMHHVAANAAEHTTPNHQRADVIMTPAPSKPLLLEGDEFYVSHDGVSRTYYQLESWASDVRSTLPVSLEEFYDLKGARKTFIVRRDHSEKDPSSSQNVVLGKNVQGVARLGSPLSVFELQEIDQGVFGSAGTGSTTWESSIAMSLFFSSNPSLLRGNVVELGSGVGLAGLLSQMSPTSLSEMTSLTLTDGNAEVVEQCQQNMNRVNSSQIPTQVLNLNWYDFMNTKEKDSSKKYDTVLASDCAYLYPDVVALSSTMASLCRKDQQSRIHVFGPYNRGALHELTIQLRDEFDMNVIVSWLEMSRYRLKPHADLTNSNFSNVAYIHSYCASEEECPYASRKTAQFLHITAWHKTPADERTQANPSIVDID
jgi:predicted nicotinamide N-methyase